MGFNLRLEFMRRQKLHLLLLSLMVISVSSCTEEISEKLKAAAADEASSGSSTNFTGEVFKVTSTNGEGFSHFLHLEGDSKKPCEIKAPATGWKAEDYSKNSAFAIDCVLDVEELDLYRNGAELQFDAGAGLCEYVSYTPLRFAQFQPGSSTKTQYTVGCDSVCGEINSDFCGNLDTKTYKSYTGATTYISNLGLNGLVSGEFSVAQKCTFDYSNPLPGVDAGPNCDNGSIKTYPLEIKSYENTWCDGGDINLRGRTSESDCTEAGVWTVGECSDTNFPDQTSCEAATETWDPSATDCSVAGRGTEALCTASGAWKAFDCRLSDNRAGIVQKEEIENECGGDTNSCFEGPGTEFGEEFTGLIWNNDSVNAFSQEVSINAPFDLGRPSNRYAASYSRACVNDSAKGAGVFASNSVPFLGHRMEELPTFDRYDAVAVDEDNNGVDDYLVYGDHPFMSVVSDRSRPRYATKPYYSVSCLDQSRDVKVQIRVHVREWDRAFLKTFDFINKVSDIDRASTLDRYIDNNELHDGDEEWNDRSDWDDFYDSSSLFPTNDCRTLDATRVPGAGSCIAPFAATYFNKKDCQDNVPRCPLNSAITKRIECGTCNLAFPNPYDCTSNGGIWTLDAGWVNNPWLSDDESKSNFPNYAK